ncbi:MAG: hypothetical protein ABWY19_14385 [Marmoricola sp.]
MQPTRRLVLVSPIVLALLTLAGCGKDFATVEPTNPDRAADGLRFTRVDRTTYELEDATARCTRVAGTGTTLVVLAAHPTDADDPSLTLRVPDGLTGTRELPLRPAVPGAAALDVSLAATDPKTGDSLTASRAPARGTMTIVEASCDPEPRLAVRIDGVLTTPQGRPERVLGGLASLAD